MNLNECGNKFGCFRKPEGCNPITSCQSVAWYTFNSETQTVEIELVGTRAWVGLGQKTTSEPGRRMVFLNRRI